MYRTIAAYCWTSTSKANKPPSKKISCSIDQVVHSIIGREEDKGVLSQSQFEPDGLEEWLEEVAFHFYDGGFSGLTVDEVEQYAELVLRGNLLPKQREQVMISLVQFPLFSSARETGLIAFEHELVCEYLAGRFMLRRMQSNPSWAARTIRGRNDLADSLIVRYIAGELPKHPGLLNAVAETLRSGSLIGRAFTNLLQILLLADPRRDLIKARGIELESRDLSFVRFEDRDLGGKHLSGIRALNQTQFRQCDLANAHFEGSYLAGTRFEMRTGSLIGATFGALEHFAFIFVNGKEIDERGDATDWVATVTGVSERPPQPCPAAQQLKTLFLKFVDPTGAPRRDEYQGRAAGEGKTSKRARAVALFRGSTKICVPDRRLPPRKDTTSRRRSIWRNSAVRSKLASFSSASRVT